LQRKKGGEGCWIRKPALTFWLDLQLAMAVAMSNKSDDDDLKAADGA